MDRTKNTLKNQGFTLVELMIVITIIAMISTFTIRNFKKKLDESKVKGTKILMHQLASVLDEFQMRCNFYPTTEQGLDALVHAPTSGKPCKDYDPDGFIKRVPQDEWGNDFVYTSDGKNYELISLGADGKPGGTGIDKDISSKDPDF